MDSFDDLAESYGPLYYNYLMLLRTRVIPCQVTQWAKPYLFRI